MNESLKSRIKRVEKETPCREIPESALLVMAKIRDSITPECHERVNRKLAKIGPRPDGNIHNPEVREWVRKFFEA